MRVMANAPENDAGTRSEARDEVSLRDLYLLLKRHAALIIGAPVLVAAAAFAIAQIGPDRYVSETVVAVTPPAIAFEGARGLSFQPPSVRFETYDALARSSPVLLAVAQHPDVVAAAGGPLTLQAVRAATGLRQLAAANAPVMTVNHTATWTEPEVATVVADVWAAQALQAVRTTLLDTLGPVDDATRLEIDELAAALAAAEAALEAFDGANLLEVARSQLATLSRRVTEGEFAVSDATRQILVDETRLATLERQLAEEVARIPSTDPMSDAVLAGLSFGEASAWLQDQARQASRDRGSAFAALEAFDAVHDLALLVRSAEQGAETVVELETALATLPAQVRVARERVAVTAAELAVQPPTLTLRDTVLENALVMEVLRAASDTNEAFALGTERTVPNPTFLALEEQLATARVEEAALVEEAAALVDEIAALTAASLHRRATLVTLQDQRSELVFALDRANARYRTATLRAEDLTVAAADPRGDRVVREGVSEVLALRAAIREQALQLESARVELDARSDQLERERLQVAQMRQNVARLETERAQLDRRVSNARVAYQDIAPLGPIIAYMTQLAPTTARVVAAATPPTGPQPRRSVVSAAVAYVVAAAALIVLVLLREAVRDPIQGAGSAIARASNRAPRSADQAGV